MTLPDWLVKKSAKLLSYLIQFSTASRNANLKHYKVTHLVALNLCSLESSLHITSRCKIIMTRSCVIQSFMLPCLEAEVESCQFCIVGWWSRSSGVYTGERSGWGCSCCGIKWRGVEYWWSEQSKESSSISWSWKMLTLQMPPASCFLNGVFVSFLQAAVWMQAWCDNPQQLLGILCFCLPRAVWLLNYQ